MSRNELSPAQCRIGFAWDRKLTEPYPAMLRDREGHLELVVPFDSSVEALRRRYLGDWVKWGDDSDLSRYDYELPGQFWFYDAHGFVCLVGVRRAGGNLIGGPTNLSEAMLRVAYAVFAGDPDADYSKINGLTAEIEGLDQWLGVRTVTNSLDSPRSTHSRDITVRIKEPTTISVDHGLNLSFRSGARWQMPGGVGTTSIEDYGLTQTTVTKARLWEDHLSRHQALHQLLEVAAWRPLGFRSIRAMHARDPERVLSGDVVGERWASVGTYQLPPAEREREDSYWFFFTYPDIGSAGVRRWLRLRENFKNGIDAMTFSIRHRVTSLQGLISDAGIGLEEIGHRIQLEQGVPVSRAHHLKLEAIATEVTDLLPFNPTTWATDSTRVYNDVKHADRPQAESGEMIASLEQNRIVFRIWLARRLGVSDEVIRQGEWLLKRS